MEYPLLVDKMQSENGKLFIGGISWDTNEERLREYFSTYGEVVEAVIMKDRTTGRARGFGFVVFADPAVAEIVIKEKHNIDGRMVIFVKFTPCILPCRFSLIFLTSTTFHFLMSDSDIELYFEFQNLFY